MSDDYKTATLLTLSGFFVILCAILAYHYFSNQYAEQMIKGGFEPYIDTRGVQYWRKPSEKLEK